MRIMSFCEGCKHKTDENYCDLFDDILFFEDCIFQEEERIE